MYTFSEVYKQEGVVNPSVKSSVRITVFGYTCAIVQEFTQEIGILQ